MKQLFIIAIMLLGTFTLSAQKVTKGSFGVLANEDVVNVSIDYKNSRIAKVPFDVFLEIEENWEEGYDEIIKKFVIGANQKSKSIKYLFNKATNYQLVFKAVKVDDDGETRGSLVLLNADESIVAEAEGFHAEGGRFGSQMNLMGDAAERLGKKVAIFIKNQLAK